MKIECNGYRPVRGVFSTDGRSLVKAIIDTLRPQYKICECEEYSGVRFNDNQAILARIESAVDEESFRERPHAWVWAALQDCARADHWYRFEKEW